MNKLFIYLILGTLALASCKRTSALFSGNREVLSIKDPQFEYLTSRAKFKFEHKGKRTPATANFRIQKDSIIWVSITPGLGVEVARVLIDRSKVKVLSKLDKQYYEYKFEDLTKQYGFDISFELIQSVVLGNLPEPYQNQKVEKVADQFFFLAEKGKYNFQNFIGQESHKLERVVVSDDSTKSTISVNYGDFMMVNQEVFPNEISAIVAYEAKDKSNTEIEISYSRVVIEENPLSFPFRVPSRYVRK